MDARIIAASERDDARMLIALFRHWVAQEVGGDAGQVVETMHRRAGAERRFVDIETHEDKRGASRRQSTSPEGSDHCVDIAAWQPLACKVVVDFKPVQNPGGQSLTDERCSRLHHVR